MSDAYIPFNRPEIGEEEIGEVVDTLRSGWLTTGARTHRFENDFRAYTGARHALAVSSGTAALHLPLAALNIGPGDEVITTPLTFCSTVATIIHSGATPVLADVDEHGNIHPKSIAERITARTRAIMPVHLGGYPCAMDAIWNLARKHKLAVIEDAAHASGTLYQGEHLGNPASSLSDAVAFSFYATKNITTGEGGMLTTNNPDLADRMRVLTLHGISKDAWNRYSENGSWFYQVMEPGFKYNLSDLQSALGIHQLRKLERFIEERRRLAAEYNERFSGIDEIEVPADCPYGRHSWHLYILRLNLSRLSINRDQFMEELRRRGVGASVHFIPIQTHPFFARWAAENRNRCPHSLELYERIISLPLYPGLTAGELERVASAVREIAEAAASPLKVAAGSITE
jgi:dTDP-4-amino-4,6-dideoxygalactose transaminase